MGIDEKCRQNLRPMENSLEEFGFNKGEMFHLVGS